MSKRKKQTETNSIEKKPTKNRKRNKEKYLENKNI